MGHIERQPSRRWRARYRAPDGRAHSKTFDRKVDAERFLTGIEHSKLTGGYVDPTAGKVTFRSFAEDWRGVQLHRLGTAQSVEQQLRLHVYPYIGHRPIAAVRPSELEAMVHHLAPELAASTVQVVFGRVVAVFRAAVRDRLITAALALTSGCRPVWPLPCCPCWRPPKCLPWSMPSLHGMRPSSCSAPPPAFVLASCSALLWTASGFSLEVWWSTSSSSGWAEALSSAL